MLSVPEALRRVLAELGRLPTERVFLAEAYERVLAEDVHAPGPLPAWPASAMDGYALRAADAPGELRVLETIPAGGWPAHRVGPGQASRIMTGAPVPEGADAVVMVEDSEAEGDRVHIRVTARVGQHLRPRGADVAAGERLLRAGETLSPGRVGLVATVGLPSVRVVARPRVALISTGDEVVEPGFSLGPGQIHSSNTHALSGLVRRAGAIPVDLGNIPDDPAQLSAAFASAAACDLVVSTGGVSVGDFDHVKAVLGGGMEFWKVDMKPGKPLAFGRIGARPVFGLPGNPVSCMVNFLQFVRPAIRTMLGDPAPFLPVVEAELDGPVRRHPGRPEFVRVSLRVEAGRLVASPAGGHQGSGNLRSMAEGHGFALVSADAPALAGRVPVQVFDPGFLAAASAEFPWKGG